MAGRRWLYLTVMLVSVVFYLAYQEWFSWFALLIVVFLPLFSFLVSLPAMLSFRAGPMGSEKAQIGAQTEVRLVGWCPLPVPPFQGKLTLHRIPTGERWTEKNALLMPTAHCGGLRAEAEKVRVYDYLGLCCIPVRNVENRVFLVRPEPVPIPNLPDPDRYLARAWRPKPGGGFAENHELRLYRPGDSLNQVHWKLSAKTGKLILREPMQPIRGRVLVTMNLRGTPAELDQKFGQLLWLGDHLLRKELRFDLRVLTAQGVITRHIADEKSLQNAVDALLCTPPAQQGDIRRTPDSASWHYHIGGDADEA